MLGSISKIRPCGHHHYYKYAHAVSGSGSKPHLHDMGHIERDFKFDTYDGDWVFSLENAESLTSLCFDGSPIVKFKSKTPKLTNVENIFSNTSNSPYTVHPIIEEIEMDFDNITNCHCLFSNTKIKKLPENFNSLKVTNFTEMFAITSGVSLTLGNNGVFPYFECIDKAVTTTNMFRNNGATDIVLDERYTFPNLAYPSAMFCWSRTSNLPENLDFKNVTTLNWTFAHSQNLTKFQTTSNMDELVDGTYAFLEAPLTEIYPNKESFSFPKLNTAIGMFQNSRLDKDSILKLCKAFPIHTDGKSRPTSIGCHINFKYDKEVNQALKNLDPSLIMPIESEGYDVLETPEIASGWTVEVRWNGTPSSSNPMFVIKHMEYDVIKLPYNYKRCEYLESNGSQWIDTEYIPSNETGQWICAKNTNLNGETSWPMGIDPNKNETGIGAPRVHVNAQSNIMYNKYIHQGNLNANVVSFYMGYVNFLNDKKGVASNGYTTLTTQLSESISFIPDISIYLFGINQKTRVRRAHYKIYRAKISEGDQIIRDFIPALDPDGKPCMYEMIEGKPYYNAATSGNDFLYKVYEDYVMPELPPYDIVEGSKYIPDASSWNEEVYTELTEKDIKIVRVVNGIAYDE